MEPATPTPALERPLAASWGPLCASVVPRGSAARAAEAARLAGELAPPAGLAAEQRARLRAAWSALAATTGSWGAAENARWQAARELLPLAEAIAEDRCGPAGADALAVLWAAEAAALPAHGPAPRAPAEAAREFLAPVAAATQAAAGGVGALVEAGRASLARLATLLDRFEDNPGEWARRWAEVHLCVLRLFALSTAHGAVAVASVLRDLRRVLQAAQWRPEDTGLPALDLVVSLRKRLPVVAEAYAAAVGQGGREAQAGLLKFRRILLDPWLAVDDRWAPDPRPEDLSAARRRAAAGSFLGLRWPAPELAAPTPEPSVPPVTAPGPVPEAAESVDPEILAIFAAEARDNLEAAEAALLRWETDLADLEAARTVYRLFHSTKGASSSVGFRRLAGLLHVLEELMQRALEGRVELARVPPLLVRGLDAFRAQLANALGEGHDTAPGDPAAELREALHDLQAGPPPAAAPAKARPRTGAAPAEEAAVRLSAHRLAALLEAANEAVALRVRAEQPLQGLLALRREWRQQERRARREAGPEAAAGWARRAAVYGAQLDRLLGQLALDLGALGQSAARVQADLAQARLAPLAPVFQRLRRAVRDASVEERKAARLEALGGHVQLDRAILDDAHDALLHLVRNAVAHGLEPPAERQAAGKPAEGVVRLAARLEGSAVVLEVADDGRGLAYERIRRKGVERGLLAPEARPGEAELAELIFHPGFSTAETTTTVSGRGVGLDAVRAAVQALNGTLSLASEAGRGTTFTLRLPLNLAQTEVVVCACAGVRTALPAIAVESVLARPPDGVVRLGLEELPVRELAGLLGLAADAPGRDVLLVRAGAFRLALAVGAVEALRTVQTKPVGPLLQHLGYATSAFLDEREQPVLILDPAALPELWRSASAAVPHRPAARRLALVVDDSPSLRQAAATLLEGLGWRVVAARDGLDALRRARREPPDLVLTDLEMPRLDGFGLVRALRADPATAGARIFATSSLAAEEAWPRLRAAGAEVFLPKPLDAARLERLLAQPAPDRPPG